MASAYSLLAASPVGGVNLGTAAALRPSAAAAVPHAAAAGEADCGLARPAPQLRYMCRFFAGRCGFFHLLPSA
jgi:hypothetical protein